jgi:asparagine synthase (glutamine-hydrolysing)
MVRSKIENYKNLNVTEVVIEEPLLGSNNIYTIQTLLRFNTLVFKDIYEQLGIVPEFISTYWSIPSDYRHPAYKNMEKWWLRKAFEDCNILPNEVLWRKKEAFSDGVSSNEKSWFQIIQDYIDTKNIDDNVKPTKEAFYYKQKFIEYFGENNLNIIPHYWQPKWINSDEYVDQSARKLNIY